MNKIKKFLRLLYHGLRSIGEGMYSIMNSFSPPPTPRFKLKTKEEINDEIRKAWKKDGENIKKDWRNVGQDIKNALKKVTKK